jgi:hypothetical protein
VPELWQRRDFLSSLAAAAGVSPTVMPLLVDPQARLPEGSDTDRVILDAAVVLEHQAVAIYEIGLERDLFPSKFRQYAAAFRGDHTSHRDTQISIVGKRGGNAPGPRSSYEFPGIGPGEAVIKVALGVEIGAQAAYMKLLSHIETNDYLLSAAFILVDEIRHMTVWREVLGYSIY